MKKNDVAKEISSKYGIPYEDVLKMTVAEVNKIDEQRFEEELAECMKDEDMWTKITTLVPDYKWLRDTLGTAFDRALFIVGDSGLFHYQSTPIKGLNYDDPETKRLFLKDVSNTYGYGSHCKYLDVRGWEYLSNVVSDALIEKYPTLIQYSPSSDRGYTTEAKWKTAIINFQIKKSGNDSGKRFQCRLTSLLKKDIRMMIEEHLMGSSFYRVKSKEEELYKEENKFLSSALVKKFFDDVMAM